MRNTKSAFTLVELIVVITILAILGTIAFISLQGYSAEARNSKRVQDLSSISSSLNIKLTRGMSVLSAVSNSDNAAATIALGGASATGVASTIYNAGDVNYTALEMKASEFQDPFGDNYAIGATTKAGGPFELAASIEQDGSEVAEVSGNFNPRTTTSVSGTFVTTSKFTLTSLTDTGRFKVGDTANGGIISNVSTDGMTILFSTPVTSTGSDLGLDAAESTGLIYDGTGESGFVVDWSTYLPY